MRPGRLLDTGAQGGAWNMALDEAMLEGLRIGRSPTTLRLYRWTRPTVSLGYAQKLDGIDVAAIAAAGMDLVRRPTGGRAVLHAQDFTYAVTASHLPEGVRASYCRLAGGLTAALERLGVGNAEVAQGALQPRAAACFAASTSADLQVGGSKLVGSAQVRRAGHVLQHGTLYLDYPAALAKAGGLEASPGSLVELLGREPSWEALSEAFQAGLGEALELPGWERDEPNAWELARAEELLETYRLG